MLGGDRRTFILALAFSTMPIRRVHGSAHVSLQQDQVDSLKSAMVGELMNTTNQDFPPKTHLKVPKNLCG
jgi:hypothetical protein